MENGFLCEDLIDFEDGGNFGDDKPYQIEDIRIICLL
jgi:hypothetical protein